MGRKGILLAGGSGTRLGYLTRALSKQLLPIYDKPMIFYPLTTLLLAGVNEVLIIASPDHVHSFKKLLGDGSDLQIQIEYAIQREPKGIAHSLIVGESFLNTNENFVLMLGDNFLYGSGLGSDLSNSFDFVGAKITAYKVHDASDLGVVVFDDSNEVIDLIEKPQNKESDWAIPGLYFYDSSALERVKLLKPSHRNELEITDLNLSYLHDGLLSVKKLQRGTAWLDLGTFDGILEASHFVKTLQDRQGLEIGNPYKIPRS